MFLPDMYDVNAEVRRLGCICSGESEQAEVALSWFHHEVF